MIRVVVYIYIYNSDDLSLRVCSCDDAGAGGSDEEIVRGHGEIASSNGATRSQRKVHGRAKSVRKIPEELPFIRLICSDRRKRFAIEFYFLAIVGHRSRITRPG